MHTNQPKPFEVTMRRNAEVWTPEDGAQMTMPDEGNIHEFRALTDCCVIDGKIAYVMYDSHRNLCQGRKYSSLKSA